MNLPNKLTIARVIAVPIFIVLYIFKFYYIALIIFVLASLTDMLDGKIARKYNLITNFGKIMDPLADKILVYSAICLMVPDLIKGWMLIIILAREFTVAGMRTVAASQGIVIAADMSGKIKTVLQMIAVPVLILYMGLKNNLTKYVSIDLSETSGLLLDITQVVYYIGEVLFILSLVMTVISGFNYIIKNKKVFKN